MLWLYISTKVDYKAFRRAFTVKVIRKTLYQENSVYPCRTDMVSYDLLLFMLKIETTTRGTNSMPFTIFRRNHLRSTSGIICGSGSSAIWGSFAVGGHLQRCMTPIFIKDQNLTKITIDQFLYCQLSQSYSRKLFINNSTITEIKANSWILINPPFDRSIAPWQRYLKQLTAGLLI